MPITVTFDISSPASAELNRIRGFFERLGWEHLGNTAYRYPKLHGQHPSEDWFNHVIPALMLRAFARYAAETGWELLGTWAHSCGVEGLGEERGLIALARIPIKPQPPESFDVDRDHLIAEVTQSRESERRKQRQSRPW